ncbi:hypothetical protein BV898_04266 [Hypsibius exemplaris]|uniref:Uncharacterized protein n=1 Tax=Hypsibius exemplaris TaxID=2072580 RepID=A0A1W0X2M1_HYPEX|nr:hypothetical protein BV898_04266 [Hypsibius exemplaris]
MGSTIPVPDGVGFHEECVYDWPGGQWKITSGPTTGMIILFSYTRLFPPASTFLTADPQSPRMPFFDRCCSRRFA